MNILLVNTFYYPNIVGGAEVSVKLLAEGLKKEKNNVAVFCIDNKDKGISVENINGVNVYRCNSGKFEFYDENDTRSLLKKIVNRIIGINNIYVGKKYREVIKEFKPDVVHVNNIMGISSIVWKITKQEGIKSIHTARDYSIINPVDEEKMNGILRKIQTKLQRIIYKKRSYNVNCITAPSKFMLDRIVETGYFKNSKQEYIYNAINLNIEMTKECIKEKIARKNDNIKFIYVGRYSKEKGIQNLLEAFEKIHNPNITLDFCGQGNKKDKIKEYSLKDKRIKDNGMLNEKELASKYKEADVIIVPSIWEEPFGRVVIEANQYGLPVIGTNRGGIKETIDLIHTGEIYQFDNIEELKEKIEYFSDRNNIKKYFDNILNNIEKYSVERHIKSYEHIYNKIKEEKI